MGEQLMEMDEGLGHGMDPCFPSKTEVHVEDPESRDSGISIVSTQSCSQGALVTATDNLKVDDLQKEKEDGFDEDSIDGEEFRQYCYKSPARKRIRSIQTKKSLGPTDFSSFSQARDHSSFLQDNFADVSDIPVTARSVHRVHSTSVLECSRDSWGSPEALEHYSLRTVDRPQVPHRAFRSIDAETLVELLKMTEEQFQRRFVMIDCRYPYEFDGGHIIRSNNVWQTDEIERLFYPKDKQLFEKMSQRIPIFYCEFSQIRGPEMALTLRALDRKRNAHRYPHLDNNEIYVLDRGYRHFFDECRFSDFCSPQGYVKMYDKGHTEKLKHYKQRVKKRKRF